MNLNQREAQGTVILDEGEAAELALVFEKFAVLALDSSADEDMDVSMKGGEEEEGDEDDDGRG